MSRTNNIEIAKDTLKTIKRGHFKLNSNQPAENKEFFFNDRIYNVKVLSPEKLQSIMNDDDDFFELSFYGSKGCIVTVTQEDSFEAAERIPNALVMNFANANTPGGGFLHGASAQEESLCRCSTLYASLSSKNAREMYDYNNRHSLPGYSDYMLLTDTVCVFKNRFGEYLENPFYTSVMTVPAPNIYGSAEDMTREELLCTIEYRLKLFLFACARYNYRNLVLGAWGCGAFGNNPSDVVRCFYDLLYKKGFNEFFDTVCFAILGGGKNYEAFKKVFDEANNK